MHFSMDVMVHKVAPVKPRDHPPNANAKKKQAMDTQAQEMQTKSKTDRERP
jgi:hypothetical protein